MLDDLHYQFIRRLEQENLVSLEKLYIDGTKFEANANRYTFVWRGSINYHLVGLLDKIDELFSRYNVLISEQGYDRKYGLYPKEMFVVSGIDKVREIIGKNRERKKSNKRKISNNRILEIDNISPLELLKLQINLEKVAQEERISFVEGKGKPKPEIQKLYEQIGKCGERLLKYQEHFRIMGSDRNSYSKTDLEATFMRMKDDHMMNGQLKPGYNVQIAIENDFVIHTYVSNDRTDYNTLIPVLEKHKGNFGSVLAEVTADSGYCSEKNLRYLEKENIESCIIQQVHEKMKTRAYKKEIGKHYNMIKFRDKNGFYYLCNNGRKLAHERTEVSRQNGLKQIFEIYACSDCSRCPFKAKCLYRYDDKKIAIKTKS